MIERLLLDGIDAEAARASVHGEHDLAVAALADEAEPALPLVQLAQPWAKVALDPAIFEGVPIFCCNDGIRHVYSDATMIERARQGCYEQNSLKDLPAEFIPEAFIRSDEVYCVRGRCRTPIQFELQDIRERMPAGPFHLILCRHLVFTCFDQEMQRALLAQMIERLVPGGVFATGKQEALPAGTAGFMEIRPQTGVYQRGRTISGVSDSQGDLALL